MKKLTEKITQFIENFKNVHAEARKIGLQESCACYGKISLSAVAFSSDLYLIALSSVP